MEFDSKKPIYMQIEDLIKLRIIRGDYNPGDKLMSIRDFAGEMKVNPNTVQRSYQNLEDSELIYTERGIGSFITEDLEKIDKYRDKMARKIVKDFIEDIHSIGMELEEVLVYIKEEKDRNGKNNWNKGFNKKI